MTQWTSENQTDVQLPEQPATGAEEHISFVYHPSFASASAENTYFGPDQPAIDVPAWRDYSLDGENALMARRRTKILSGDEERQLFLRYNYASYRLSQAMRKRQRRPAAETEAEIGVWQRRVSQQRSALIHANMALVVAMAIRSRIAGADVEELVAEGNMALLRCIEKFDVSRGFKFSTYACRAIVTAFRRLAYKSDRYQRRFSTSYEPEMDRPDRDDRRYEARWADSVDWLSRALYGKKVELNPVERRVIAERYGLRSRGPGKKLAEVGKVVGLSNERVRQILNKAQAKIRVALDEDVLVA